MKVVDQNLEIYVSTNIMPRQNRSSLERHQSKKYITYHSYDVAEKVALAYLEKWDDVSGKEVNHQLHRNYLNSKSSELVFMIGYPRKVRKSNHINKMTACKIYYCRIIEDPLMSVIKCYCQLYILFFPIAYV